MRTKVFSARLQILFFCFVLCMLMDREIERDESLSLLPLSRPLLNKHQHHRKQSSVGGVRLLRVTIAHVAFGEARIEVTYELLDVGELFVEIVKPKTSREKLGGKGKEKC